jgi:hypothetical protein
MIDHRPRRASDTSILPNFAFHRVGDSLGVGYAIRQSRRYRASTLGVLGALTYRITPKVALGPSSNITVLTRGSGSRVRRTPSLDAASNPPKTKMPAGLASLHAMS